MTLELFLVFLKVDQYFLFFFDISADAGKIPQGFLTYWNTVYCVGQESIL